MPIIAIPQGFCSGVLLDPFYHTFFACQNPRGFALLFCSTLYHTFFAYQNPCNSASQSLQSSA